MINWLGFYYLQNKKWIIFGNLRHTILTHVLFILQFTSWVDAVIFVFSLENEASFNAIYNYYVKMSQFRNMQEIPLILVGTQGKFKIFKVYHYAINKEIRETSIYIVSNIFWNVSKSKSSHFPICYTETNKCTCTILKSK